MADEPARRVYLFGTGGTISFVGESRTDFSNYSYRGQQLTIQEMLARVPEAGDLAEVIPEQVINVGSTEVYPPHWLTLARRINERFAADPDAAGAAVTHGTATLEETAYFLNLTVRDSRPVAVTGAMRPPSAMGTDADNNLLDAVRIAAAPQRRSHKPDEQTKPQKGRRYRYQQAGRQINPFHQNHFPPNLVSCCMVKPIANTRSRRNHSQHNILRRVRRLVRQTGYGYSPA